MDYKGSKVKSQVYSAVRDALNDNLLIAKLEFFKTVSLLMEPFLRKFQFPKPMFPFLNDAIEMLKSDQS